MMEEDEEHSRESHANIPRSHLTPHHVTRTRTTTTTRQHCLWLAVDIIFVALLLHVPQGCNGQLRGAWSASASVCSNCPSSCVCSEVAASGGGCRYDCSDTQLSDIPPDYLPTDVHLVHEIDLSANQLTSLHPDTFTALTQLQNINLADNPFSCTCHLLWLKTWLNDREATAGLSVDGEPVCHTPITLVNMPVRKVPDSWFVCVSRKKRDSSQEKKDADDYVTCVRSSVGVEAIVFKDLTDSAATSDECEKTCSGYAYFGFYTEKSNEYCLCGNDNSMDPGCKCPDFSADPSSEPSKGDTVCGRKFVPLSIVTPTRVELDDLRTFSSQENAELKVKNVPSAQEYVFDFGDGTQALSSTARSASHAYLLQGAYATSVTISEAGGETVADVNVRILDPPRVTGFSAPTYVDGTAGEELDVEANLEQGTETSIRWYRTNPDGSTIQGGFCDQSWSQFQDVCVFAVSSPDLGYAGARLACLAQGGKLADVENQQQALQLVNTLAIDSTSEYLISSESASECRVISSAGLDAAADCDTTRGYVCQKEPSVCRHGGIYHAGSDLCYLATIGGKQTTFTAAENACEGVGGHLVSVTNAEVQEFILQNVTNEISSSTSRSVAPSYWIGLNDRDLEGSYTWTLGGSLTSSAYSSWGTSAFDDGDDDDNDCTLLVHNDTLTTWDDDDCGGIHDYVCQYPPGDTTFVRSSVAGLGAPVTGPATNLVPETPTPGYMNERYTTFLMPGAYLTKAGSLQKWHLQVTPMNVDTTMRLQIFRPSCNNSYIVHPGCSDLPTPYSTCNPWPVTACRTLVSTAQDTCPQGEQFCPLVTPVGDCLPTSEPCTCPNHAATASCADTPYLPSSEEPTYKLAHHITVTLPAGGQSSQHRVVTPDGENFKVNKFDLIGFQFKGDLPPIQCSEDTNSNWRQNIMVLEEQDSWNALTMELDTANSTWLEDYVCQLSAVYSFPASLELPFNVAHMPFATEGTYSVKLNVKNRFGEVDSEKVVDILEPITGFELLEPAVDQTEGYLLIEAGVDLDMLFMIRDGNYARLEGENMSEIERFKSACPDKFPGHSECATISADEQFAATTIELQSTLTNTTYTVIDFLATNTAFNESITINILAQERITNLDLVPASPPAQVGNNIDLVFKVGSGSHMMFDWEESCDQQSGKTNESVITVSFSQPNLCEFTVKAENGINTVDAIINIMVCQKTVASDLEISHEPIVTADTNIDLTFAVNLKQFSCLLIVYDFGDNQPVRYVNHEEATGGSAISISANYNYAQSGTFDVSVTILDALDNSSVITASSKIVVNHPISSVVILSEDPIATGQETEIILEQTGGTGAIYYSVTYGDGIIETSTDSIFSHTFTDVQRYSLEATASNNISSVSASRNIWAFEPISGLKLAEVKPTLLGETITFSASVMSGLDATFQYYIHDFESPEQKTGSFEHLFTELGKYNVTVVAFNNVSRSSDEIFVYVIDTKMLDILPFDNSTCVEMDTSITWTANMVHFDPSILNYDWDFGDGSTDSGLGKVSVDHTYISAGKYNLKVKATDDYGNQTSTNADICVQERISGFSANHNGPGALSKGGVVTLQMSASITFGTDAKYRWIWGNFVDEITDDGQFTLDVSTAGTVKVTVSAFNDINELDATLNIPVYEIIEDLDIEYETLNQGYVATGQNYKFTALTSSGSNVQYSWNIDGQISSTLSTFWNTFDNIDSFSLGVTASNPVSSGTKTLTLHAQEIITNVDLSSDVSAVNPGQGVSFTVTHDTGSNVEYSWKFCQSCDYVIGSESYDYAFLQQGEYNVTVLVHNKISNSSQTRLIEILLPLTGLEIIVSNLTQTGYIESEAITDISWVVDSGVIVSDQSWEIEDVNVNYLVKSGDEKTLQHSFDTGEYAIKLSVRNSLESVEVVKVMRAAQKIKGLEIMYAGETDLDLNAAMVEMEGHILKGTEVEYTWIIDRMDIPEYIKTQRSQNISYEFETSGEFRVRLNATNPVSTEEKTLMFWVHRAIGNATILAPDSLTFPYVPAYQPIRFIAEHDVSEYDTYNYIWIFSYPGSRTQNKMKYTTKEVLHKYNASGSARVSLAIKNPVSQLRTSTNVFVEEEIKDLEIGLNVSVVAKGSLVSCEAVISQGTDIEYEWSISKSQDLLIKTNASDNIMYVFDTIGTYTIDLEAENHVSQETASAILVVEERIERLGIVECCDYSFAYGYEVVLTAKIEHGTNVEYNWTVMDEFIIEYPGPKMKHFFTQPGIYNVGITARNALNSETLWIEVIVENPILDVQIVADNNLVILYENVNVEFMADVTGGQPWKELTYEWFLNGKQLVVDTQTFIKNFTDTDNKQELEVQVSNNISMRNDSISFWVYQVICDSPILTPSGGTRRSEVRSRLMEFEIGIDACIKYVLKHTWKVYKGTCAVDLDRDEVALPSNVTVTSPMLVLPARTLDYGVYCVWFRSQYEPTPTFSEVLIDLTIIPSALQAIIAGGNERTLPRYDPIVINGTQSYDPDIRRDDDQGLTYYWTCTAVRGIVSGNTITDHNCFPPTNTSVVTIPSNTFHINWEYTITLMVSKLLTRSANASQKLTIQKFRKVPSVSTECLSCREKNLYAISASTHLKLVGTCHNCELLGFFYHWTVLRDDGLPLMLDTSNTRTGNDKPNLSIKRNVLEDGHSYTFTLNVTSEVFMSWGVAKLELEAVNPPSDGQCEASIPSDGQVEALKDDITVNCSGWKGHAHSFSLLTYHVFIRSSPSVSPMLWYPVYRGAASHCSFKIAPFEDDLEQVEIIVEVMDKVGAMQTALTQPITMKPLDPPANMTVTQYVAELHEEQMELLLRRDNPKELLQYAIAVSLTLNGEAAKIEEGWQDAEGDAKIRETIRDSLLRSLNFTTTLSTIDDLQQLAYTLQLITTYPTEFPREEVVYGIITELLDRITAAITPLVSPGLTGDEFVPEYIIATVGNFIKIIQFELQQQSGGMQHSNKQVLIESSMAVADDILYLLLRTQVVDEEAILLSTDYIHSEAQLVHATGIQREFAMTGCQVELPEGLLADLQEEQVFQVVTSLLSNPYSWGEIKEINSHVVDIYFRHKNGTYIVVKGLDEQRTIQIGLGEEKKEYRTKGSTKDKPRNKRDTDFEEEYMEGVDSQKISRPKRAAETFANNVQTILFKPKEMLSTKLDTSQVKGVYDGVAMTIEFEGVTVPWVNQTSASTPKSEFTAYVGRGYVPHKFEFDFELNMTVNATTAREEHIIFISQSLLGNPNEIYYLTIVNHMPEHQINVSVVVYFTVCQYYVPNKMRWFTDACLPLPVSSLTWAACQCSHLTQFGGSMLLAPGDLDFANLLGLDLQENPVAIIVLCVLAVVFILLAILARRWDIKDMRKISVVPLCGKDGPYKYEITVMTGRRKAAGTTANVGVRLYGEHTKSGTCHLAQPEAFQRNSTDTFLVATETSLGDVYRVRIWHDNTGLDPDWYLSKLIVRDLQQEKKWYFVAGCWLSLAVQDKQEATVEKDLFAAAPGELGGFWSLLGSETSRGVVDRHLWISMFDRPARTRFTRVQRVACGATMLYTYMAANAMWYGVLRIPSEYEQVTGRSPIGWVDVAVGMAACLVALPLCILAVLVFQKSKRKPDPMMLNNKPGTAQTVEMEMEVAGSRETSAFGGHRAANILNIPSDLERESTSDSLSTRAGALRRTQPGARRIGPLTRQESYLSDMTSVIGEVNGSRGGAAAEGSRKIPGVVGGEGGMWSYDTILHWPEELPNFSSSSSSDSRQSSAATAFKPIFRQRTFSESEDSRRPSVTSMTAEPPTGRRGSLPRSRRDNKARRRQSVTDSIDQLLEEIDEIDEHATQVELRSSMRSLRSKNSESRQSTSTRKTSTETVGSMKKGHKVKDGVSGVREDGAWGAREEALDRESTGMTSSSNRTRKRSRTMSIDSWASFAEGPPRAVPLAPAYSLPINLEEEEEPAMWNNTNWTPAFSTVPQPTPSKPERCLLPWWAVVVAYVYCGALVLFSALVVLLYGDAYGRDVALRWLTACFCSFLISFLVLEPLKVIILAVLIAVWTGTIEDTEELLDKEPALEANEKIKDVSVRPLGGYALLQAKEEGKKLWQMRSVLRHFLVYFVFVWVIMVLNYASHDWRAWHLNKYVKNTMTETTFGGKRTFADIRDYNGYWQWLDEVVAPGLHLGKTDKYATNSFLLGTARLRQIRAEPESCSAQKSLDAMRAGNITRIGCYGNPGWTEDKQPWGVGWSDVFNSTWQWQETDSIPFHGETAIYSGDGYVQYLGQTERQSREIIALLKTQEWIDRSTRAVFLEYTQYSVNTDLYSAVTLVVEFPVSSSAVPGHRVETLQLVTLSGGLPAVYLICEVVMLCFLVYMLVQVILAVRLQRVDYIKSLWNWMELVITGLTLGSFCVYCVMVRESVSCYKRFLADMSGYTGFNRALYWMEVWKSLNAILLFILMFMVVRQLRFIKWLCRFGRVLSRSSGSLLGVGLLCGVLMVAYSHTAYLYLGHVAFSFRTFGASLVGLTGLLRGSPDYLDAAFSYDRAFAILFFVSFAWLLLVLGFGLVLAVLSSQYRAVRSEMSCYNTMDMQDYEMIDFMMKRFKKWAGITKQKPAFRKVKFQGLPTASTCTSRPTTVAQSSSTSSGDSGLLVDLEDEQIVHEEMLTQTWTNMWTKFEQVEVADVEEDDLLQKLEHHFCIDDDNMTSPHRVTVAAASKPPKPPLRSRSLSESKLLVGGGPGVGVRGRRVGVSMGSEAGRPFSDQGQREVKGLPCKQGWAA